MEYLVVIVVLFVPVLLLYMALHEGYVRHGIKGFFYVFADIIIGFIQIAVLLTILWQAYRLV